LGLREICVAKLVMKKIIVILAGCYLAITASAQQTPVEKNGALRVEHGQVVNQHGVPPELKGISFSWSIWQGKKYYNPQVVDWLTGDFKISLMRVAMAVQPQNGYLQQPLMQQQLVDIVVDEAIKNGIYVLIDWHDHNGNQHLQQSKHFFATIAQKYNKAPNVIYEIWNEPEQVSWDTVKNYAIQVITEIRKYDANNLIVVGSPHWDQDVDIVANDPIVGFSNIAYSFHFYASDPNPQEALRARADKAIKSGLPLIVTEWGVGEANGNGKFDLEENSAWLQWLKKNKLSWANWNLTDKNETTALLMPGAPEKGGWADSQLSPAGAYIRNMLREENK
jgi:endoglucanase